MVLEPEIFPYSASDELSRQGYGSFSNWSLLNFGSQELIVCISSHTKLILEVFAELSLDDIEHLVSFRYQSNFPTFCWGTTFTGNSLYLLETL